MAGSCPWDFLRKGLHRKDPARPEGRITRHAVLAKAYKHFSLKLYYKIDSIFHL